MSAQGGNIVFYNIFFFFFLSSQGNNNKKRDREGGENRNCTKLFYKSIFTFPEEKLTTTKPKFC